MKESSNDLPPDPFGDKPLFEEQPEESSDLSKVLEHMLKPQNLPHMTELSNAEINAFATLGSLAAKHKIKIIEEWLLKSLSYRVSKGRKGRLETVKITSRAPIMEEQKQPRFPWLFGGR